MGYTLEAGTFFDTLSIQLPGDIESHAIENWALRREVNFYYPDQKTVRISMDETVSLEDINVILEIFSLAAKRKYIPLTELGGSRELGSFERKSDFMKQDVFNNFRSETELMRYIKKLERKDFSLTHSMISLGSCTMKLNAAIEMLAMSWPEFGNIHPFVPLSQAEGYQQLFNELSKDLKINH